MRNNKYLPGYSYGMSGGPQPLSWRNHSSTQDLKPAEGNYTFDLLKSGQETKRVTFWAHSYRIAELKAEDMADAHFDRPNNYSFVLFQAD